MHFNNNQQFYNCGAYFTSEAYDATRRRGVNIVKLLCVCPSAQIINARVRLCRQVVLRRSNSKNEMILKRKTPNIQETKKKMPKTKREPNTFQRVKDQLT